MAVKLKKIIGLVMSLILVFSTAVSGPVKANANRATWADNADTSWYDPVYQTYTIDSPAKLAGVAKLVNEDAGGTINGLNGKILELDGDVDLSPYLWVPIGTEEKPFRGTLLAKNGSSIISGMNVASDAAYQGLIGNMTDATIGGFTFDASGSINASDASADLYAGAAVGKMSGTSTVYDITNNIGIETSSSTDAYVGGIVGMGEGTIANSFNNGHVTVHGSAYVGGIVGYGDAGGLKIKKVTNEGEIAADGQSSGAIVAGGIAGYSVSSLAMDEDDTVISNKASVTVNDGVSVYAGGIGGKLEGTIALSKMTTNAGAVSIDSSAASSTYAGALAGAIGAMENPELSIPFTPTAAVTNHGGTNVYTGGIVGYAASSFIWKDSYTNSVPIAAEGTQNVYTGGLVGYAAKGIVLDPGHAYEQAADINVAGGANVYTGGIVGYAVDGNIMHVSYKGKMEVTGSADVYSGGIAGYVSQGTITDAVAGDKANHYAAITSDGTIGGIVGYLDGTVDHTSVKFMTLKATSAGGVAGGIAGNAQGKISGAVVGDADAADYNSVRIESAIANPLAGKDNVVAGGLVGVNEHALNLVGSHVTKVGFITEDGKKGYTFGAIAGQLTDEAIIGEAGNPIEVKDIQTDLLADEANVGGAIGINRAKELYLHTDQIEVRAKGAAAHIGGLFGENHAAAPHGLAENITITAQGVDNELGGIAGYNTGTLTDAAAQLVSITAEGANAKAGGIAGYNTGTLADAEAQLISITAKGAFAEAGGIAGRSEAAQGASNGGAIISPVLHAGDAPLVTVTGADAKAGGIVGYAKAADITNPTITAEEPDYITMSIQAARAVAGGVAGVVEDGKISGDAQAINIKRLFLNTSAAATDAFVGGIAGYNNKSRLEKLVGQELNLFINGERTVAGGVTGYNLGTSSAIVTKDYITGLNLKVNAAAASSTVGGLIGLNDARMGDPVSNPGPAVSTIQNSRIMGSINADSPSSLIGGMVGENRSFIANNSIVDKTPVVSKGNASILGGLIGLNTSTGMLYYTYSNANLSVEGKDALAGGLVGENTGQVKNSYVDIDVTGKAYGTASKSVSLGGLIGKNNGGTIEQSYTSSKVTAMGSYTVVGGLVGEHVDGIIKDSYVANSVSANADHSYAGGFIGRITNGKVTNGYSAAEVTAVNGAYAGGFAGRYDNASKELITRAYYIKDEARNLNKDLPDFAEGNYRWLNVQARLSTLLSETLKDRLVFPSLSGWDFSGVWKYGSPNAAYQYPELNRDGNTGGDDGNDVNANINWYMRDQDAPHFELKSEAELAGLAAIVNGTITGVEKFDFQGRTIDIINPIHIQSKQWIPIGETENSAFQGTFNGNQQLIDGLTILPEYTNAGLFGVIGKQATVQNIKLEPVSIEGNQYTGGLAGLNLGTVSGAELKLLDHAIISGGTVGGIIGKNSGNIEGLRLTLDGGSTIETIQNGGVVGGFVGDNTSNIESSTLTFEAKDGRIGSSAEHTVVGGIIGKQAGDVKGLNVAVGSKYILSTTGSNSITGGFIGHQSSGSDSELMFTIDGSLEARGSDSILGGIVGQSDVLNTIHQVSVIGGTNASISGNGIVGGIVGLKEGAGTSTFDIEHASIEKVKLSTVDGGLHPVIGGIAGQAVHTAMNDTKFKADLQAVGESVTAGGIVGQGQNSILFDVEVVADINAVAKKAEGEIGGVAGSMAADDINQGLDFGKSIPLYKGIYNANVHHGTIKASGVGNQADLSVGGIVAKNMNASIYQSESSSVLTVTGGKTVNVGGIAGYSTGIIVDSAANNSINADTSHIYKVGGVVGSGVNGEIHYSSATSASGEAITIGTTLSRANSLPVTHAGGFIGEGDNIKITGSYANIPLNITDTNQDNTIYAGGFAGLLGESNVGDGTIQRSYASGNLDVNGKLGIYAGGFAGSVDHFNITSSYATGNISNTGLDTRSGGFAAIVERKGSISKSYALQEKIATIGVRSATRSYSGGFAGYNDGTLSNVYANVPKLTVDASGANVFNGALVGYNFRDGIISVAKYTGASAPVGHNAGAAADAAQIAAYNPLTTGEWNNDIDTSFLSNTANGEYTLDSKQQLAGAVLLYNETGLEYYRLFNRTATAVPSMDKLSLGADIDLSGSPWTPFASFNSIFDGREHTIRGLQVSSVVQQNVGFVSENNGEIANVNFEAAKIEVGSNIGIVAGLNNSGGIIHGINIIGTVMGNEAVGGAAGVNKGTITDVHVKEMILQGTGNTGGIAGFNEGTISKSSSNGNVNSTGTSGGITGANEGSISQSSFNGSLNGTNTGGIAGSNKGTITQSKSDAGINGTSLAGGITGINEGTISQSNSAGNINGTATAGGITGENGGTGVVAQSFSYMDVHTVSELATAGGIVGKNEGRISDSYSSGFIYAEGTSKAWAGGIAGYAASGTIATSINTGEVLAGVNGKIAPLQAFFGGIVGQKADGAVVQQTVFNKQMLKSNTAYYNAEGKSVSGNTGDATGMYGAELVTDALPGAFNANIWEAKQGFYPGLKAFTGTDESLLATVAVILDKKDLVNQISSGFTLTSDRTLSWSADSSKVVISGNSGTLKTMDYAVLIASAHGKSRSITINSPALKFLESAEAPVVVSGDKKFVNEVSVILSTAERDGSIYYTLDNSSPTESSILYTGPIVLKNDTTIKAITIVDGKEYSAVMSGVWEKQEPFVGGGGGGGPIIPVPPVPSPAPTPAPVPAPVPTPAISAVVGKETVNGSSTAPIRVARNSKLKLTAAKGNTIYYTTDGSNPTKKSVIYKGEIIITRNMTIKAITDQDDRVITIQYTVENASYNLKSNADEIKYMTAYSNGLFKPNAAISRYELINALAPLLDMEEVSVANLFNDVKGREEDLVAFFASAGIIQGYPDGGFGGDKGLTRAEFAVIMTRVLNLDISNAGPTKQSDMKGHWSEPYVNALAKAGYVTGFPDGSFKPNNKMTRAEAVVMINRIIGTKKINPPVKFSDLPVTHWAYKDIMSVVE